ncbi:carbon-nitrogen hydrolase [Chaetomium strumarium]|uniref:Carbon-nitrogen hydrolase n=1 Tax=Chaetomium strumarium TaxID=1170767 RepID=A0AAJ0H002_9PEZI|nr:carbon-nitrogen hydrolase [Chaetomium strumarium]
MRIACLQFAPRVGDIENNLDRADAVLHKANADELDGLDLLVLPELAFTGYNFKSLKHISPFFEEADSGITSLWARTTALKYDCTVVVGYPEQVDVSAKWPASPEFYNSAIVVNGDGDSIGNYRKSFLYYTDETWALEGADGFFSGEIPRLGSVALGICTDLNPYKLEAPWDAFEFGYHVLEAQANVVILTMAWQTHQDASLFTLNPAEPDLETLVYWVQRLEPLIRAEQEEEIIVVFCNRIGAEDEATYTGTSAVIGIKKGEVFVYGVLGRGVNELLVVDTNQPPRSKLTDADAGETDDYFEAKPALDTKVKVDGRLKLEIPGDISPEEDQVRQCHLSESGIAIGFGSPRKVSSPRLPWLAQPVKPGGTPTDSRSPTRLQIPTRPQHDEYIAIDSAVTDDIVIDTEFPDTPGFTRRPQQTSMAIPTSPSRSQNKPSPYPWHHPDGSHSAVFGGGATMTPITPFDEDGWSATPIDAKAPGWFWRHEPTLSALKESIVEEEEEEDEKEETRESPETQPRRATAGGVQSALSLEMQEAPGHRDDGIGQPEQQADEPEDVPYSGPLSNDWADLAHVLDELRTRPGSALDFRSSRDDRPSSPKFQNLARNTGCSDLAFDESDPEAPAAYESDLYRPASRNDWGRGGHVSPSGILPASPSTTGNKLLQRSNSFDGVIRGNRHSGRSHQRQPSALRHAVSFSDHAEGEPNPRLSRRQTAV